MHVCVYVCYVESKELVCREYHRVKSPAKQKNKREPKKNVAQNALST